MYMQINDKMAFVCGSVANEVHCIKCIYVYTRDVNECRNWYSNIRIGYSNIFEYSNDIHIYAK